MQNVLVWGFGKSDTVETYKNLGYSYGRSDLFHILTNRMKLSHEPCISSEPHSNSWKVTSATSEESDQPAHPQILLVLGYSYIAQWRLWSDCADVHADMSLRLVHMQYGTTVPRFICNGYFISISRMPTSVCGIDVKLFVGAYPCLYKRNLRHKRHTGYLYEYGTRMECFQWILRTASSEKVPLNMRKMCRFKSSCTCAKYYPDFCFPLIHSVISEGWSGTSLSANARRHVFAWRAPMIDGPNILSD